MTRAGEVIETDGPWKVVRNRVVFTARSSNQPVVLDSPSREQQPVPWLAGILYSISVADVDLARSEAETARRLALAQKEGRLTAASRARQVERSARTIPEAPHPIRSLEAGELWADSRHSTMKLEARVRFDSSSNDNFFQAPDSEMQDAIVRTGADVRLTWRLSPKRPHKLYVQAAQVDYEELPSSSAYSAGWRHDGRRHLVDFSALVGGGQRSSDDSINETSELTGYGLRYSFRRPRWEWQLAGQFRDQSIRPSSASDSNLLAAQTSFRLRSFGRVFSPELGAGWARRDGENEGRDYSQQEVFARLNFRPLRSFGFSLRYRQRSRDYQVLDPRARNFGREDQRDQWTLNGEVVLHRTLAFNFFYSYLEGDSSQSGRAFSSQTVGGGFTAKVGTGWRR